MYQIDDQTHCVNSSDSQGRPPVADADGGRTIDYIDIDAMDEL